jgi:hypothetical protein
LFPVLYEITFATGDDHRKVAVRVMAADVMEAVELAKTITECHGRVVRLEECSPRWMQSDAAHSPDLVSEAVLRHYAAKIGLRLV